MRKTTYMKNELQLKKNGKKKEEPRDFRKTFRLEVSDFVNPF